jgi:hypothetical protein
LYRLCQNCAALPERYAREVRWRIRRHFGDGEIKGWGLKDFTSLASEGSQRKPLQAELLLRYGHITGNIQL